MFALLPCYDEGVVTVWQGTLFFHWISIRVTDFWPGRSDGLCIRYLCAPLSTSAIQAIDFPPSPQRYFIAQVSQFFTLEPDWLVTALTISLLNNKLYLMVR